MISSFDLLSVSESLVHFSAVGVQYNQDVRTEVTMETFGEKWPEIITVVES